MCLLCLLCVRRVRDLCRAVTLYYARYRLMYFTVLILCSKNVDMFFHKCHHVFTIFNKKNPGIFIKKYRIFGQKPGFSSKKPGFSVKKLGFFIKKPGILVKNRDFGQKNGIFGQKSGFLTKNGIFGQKPGFMTVDRRRQPNFNTENYVIGIGTGVPGISGKLPGIDFFILNWNAKCCQVSIFTDLRMPGIESDPKYLTITAL